MMENLFVYHSPFGDVPVRLRIDSYVQNRLSLAVSIIDADDGLPYSTATVNLGPYAGNDSLLSQYCAFLDTNNMPGIEDFLIENGLAEPYTRFGSKVYEFSGFSSYPLFSFKAEALKELDPEGCVAYEAGYQEALEEELKKIYQATFGLDYDWSADPKLEQQKDDKAYIYDIADIVDDTFALVENYYTNGYKESYWTPIIMSGNNLSSFGILLTPEKAVIEMAFLNKESESFVLSNINGKLYVSATTQPAELSVEEAKRQMIAELLSAIEKPSTELFQEAMFNIEDLSEQMAEQEAGGIEEEWELE